MAETEPLATTDTRKKKSTPRVRTGCQTCKVRRIKCDEAPGSCRNCTSTGRKCDRYEMPLLPRRRKPLGPIYLCANLPGKSSDEKRCFGLFQSLTIPMFVTLFDSDLWRVVLQMSQEDLSVCHAVIALSALHEETLLRLPYRAPDSPHWDFAVKQYGRALGSLVRRLESNDPQMRYTALVCCLVFIMFEFLNDNYGGALVHLQNGVNVLTNGKGQLAREAIIRRATAPLETNCSHFDVALQKTFAHLDVQSAHFNQTSSRMNFFPTNGDLIDLNLYTVSFDSLNGAKETLDPLLNNAFHIWKIAESVLRRQLTEPDNSVGYLHLLAHQQSMRRYLSDHIACFQQFLTKFTPTTPKHARSLDIIRLHQVILHLNVETSVTLSEMIFDNYLPEWTEAVDLADRIVKSSIAEFGSSLPNLVIDLGVTLPLSWAALKCRDFTLRQRALDLLKLWPHSEGLHDTALLLALNREIFALEREGLDPVTQTIPEHARVRTVNIEMDKERETAKLVYSFSKPTTADPPVLERVFRVIFRIIEFAGDNMSKLSRTIDNHEVLEYIFDSMPMFFALIIFNVAHPGKILVGPDAEWPKVIKEEKKASKRAKNEGRLAANTGDSELFGSTSSDA
ncbi:hypothetical protein BJY01DRAFT_245107 [Aspergillus pseudoustus]|uniref:Zn(2)-C6 fungal-type domain-containing protein n=1 Tax=Aspergillus pseudoustus TaxID=1810923 RepID=A0ABR4KG33_9EURO